MANMPKRVKFRKSQRGKMRGNATRGNTVAFGEYGLQTLVASWISAKQIEAGGGGGGHFFPPGGRFFFPVFPPQPNFGQPLGGGMGGGEGGAEILGAGREAG